MSNVIQKNEVIPFIRELKDYVWVEFKDSSLFHLMPFVSEYNDSISFDLPYIDFNIPSVKPVLMNCYGLTWRIWSDRPSDHEMGNTLWKYEHITDFLE